MLQSIAKGIFWVLIRLLSGIWSIFRFVRKSIYTVILVGLIGFNVATLTISGVNLLLSNAIDAVAQILPTKSKPLSVRKKMGNEAQTLIVQRDEARKLNRSLTDDLGASQKRNTRLARTAEEVSAKNLTLTTKFDRTSERIIRRSRRTAARNISSLAAEGVPAIGYGVVVVVTAMELRDMCATMQDVENLRTEFGVPKANPDNNETLCGFEMPSLEEVVGPQIAKKVCEYFQRGEIDVIAPISDGDAKNIACNPINPPPPPDPIGGDETPTEGPTVEPPPPISD